MVFLRRNNYLISNKSPIIWRRGYHRNIHWSPEMYNPRDQLKHRAIPNNPHVYNFTILHDLYDVDKYLDSLKEYTRAPNDRELPNILSYVNYKIIDKLYYNGELVDPFESEYLPYLKSCWNASYFDDEKFFIECMFEDIFIIFDNGAIYFDQWIKNITAEQKEKIKINLREGYLLTYQTFRKQLVSDFFQQDQPDQSDTFDPDGLGIFKDPFTIY